MKTHISNTVKISIADSVKIKTVKESVWNKTFFDLYPEARTEIHTEQHSTEIRTNIESSNAVNFFHDGEPIPKAFRDQTVIAWTFSKADAALEIYESSMDNSKLKDETLIKDIERVLLSNTYDRISRISTFNKALKVLEMNGVIVDSYMPRNQPLRINVTYEESKRQEKVATDVLSELMKQEETARRNAKRY